MPDVRLVFLPPNTTAKTEPMNAGISRCLKAHYRKNPAKLCLLAYQVKKEFKVDVLEAMTLFKTASGRSLLLLQHQNKPENHQ